ncbi:Pycsar system effector family protein [Olleya sp. R77988]|uniref:Pycsar system effector family protein n=1 Tax=Olleya sp. R77988 TaxID=3093875 RepID=UPI0037CA81F3
MENVIIETEKHVSQLLTSKLEHTFFYHNLSHTQRVVKSILELAEGEKTPKKDTQLLKISAWFHDIGYINGCKNHEEESAKLASTFLKNHNVSEADIASITGLILATKINYEPKNSLEKIIRDADSSHFGSKNYIEICDLLRAEWDLTQSKAFTDSEWTQENIQFLSKHHHFYTNYAQENWQKRKDKNLVLLLKTLKKQQAEELKAQTKAEEFQLKKNKATLPERGIETMFRVTLKNHITLSNIADTKANILLSVNAIIVSLVLSNLVSKLDNPSNGYLIIPTVVFVLFTVASIILSILATRPNVTSGKFNKEDVKNKKVNLLFFGNFHKMSLDDFEWAMGEMMQDRDYLYSSMKKDLYFLGLVLNKKYKILRLTYTVFMIGIIVSVLTFAIAFKTQG